MSEKKRQKKDHADAGKKRKRMRESVKGRKRRAAKPKKSTDEVDTVKFKPGSAGDKRRTGP